MLQTLSTEDRNMQLEETPSCLVSKILGQLGRPNVLFYIGRA